MVTPELVQKVQSVAAPDVNVKQSNLDPAVSERLASVGEVPGFPHLPTVQLEVDPAEKPDRGIVVDDENGMARRIHAAGQCTRIRIANRVVYRLKMTNEPTHPEESRKRDADRTRDHLPRPTPQFRRRAWLAFQRALDPLAPPRPLRRRQR
jgi:hypothetical protein